MLPLTHFVRATRGVLLKGEGGAFIGHEMWPVALFGLDAAVLALAAYRRRLRLIDRKVLGGFAAMRHGPEYFY